VDDITEFQDIVRRRLSSWVQFAVLKSESPFCAVFLEVVSFARAISLGHIHEGNKCTAGKFKFIRACC
jgi:hypothetical protein